MSDVNDITQPHQAAHLRRRLLGEPGEMSELRDHMRRMAVASGFEERAVDLNLVLGELVANAQEHGAPPVEVEAWADGRLVLEVRDGAGTLDTANVWPDRRPSPHGQRGRGMWIVRLLADVVNVRSGHGCTAVRVELSHEPQLGA
ncbi:MAG: ATP-binding protein [Thermoleophilia bacterium]